MTLSDASILLGVHPDTLRRQIRLGKLKGRKVGPIWTVTSREVDRYRRESLRFQSQYNKLERMALESENS